MRKIANIFFILCLLPLATSASESGIKLDQVRIRPADKLSLQRGAQAFVNYCLSCHSAHYMRYNRHRDLGLSENQISNNLIFTGQKVGDLMTVAMKDKDAKQWFGIAPPDLSVIARSRGADWLYTYLRTFYRDDSTDSGWNNLLFDKVAMPHVLYQLQGEQVLAVNTVDDGHGGMHEVQELKLDKPGALSKTEYDAYVTDLVNYLVYVGEPAASKRIQLGIIVMLFLFVMLGLTYALKREYWKDIH